MHPPYAQGTSRAYLSPYLEFGTFGKAEPEPFPQNTQKLGVKLLISHTR